MPLTASRHINILDGTNSKKQIQSSNHAFNVVISGILVLELVD